MRRITVQQGVLGGALVVVAGFWAVDRLTGVGGPASAQADPSQPGQSSVGPAAWQDVSELVTSLTGTEYQSVAGEVEGLRRDLFVPTPLIDAAFAEPEPAVISETPELEEDVASQPDFASRHRLGGVIIGDKPLAVIDDRLLPIGSELDGHTLVEVHRDCVVFRQVGTELLVTLELEQRPENPPPNGP